MAGPDPWAFSPRASPLGIHVLATDAGGISNPVDARVTPGLMVIVVAPVTRWSA